MLFLISGGIAMEPKREVVVFGGGCFWCIEAIFTQVKGVTGVISGYAGGTTPNPTYEEVCAGITGHAEVVRVEFDPNQIRYEELVRLFFHVHDPTTRNRQGNDEGTQYRSIILVKDDMQKAGALRVMAEVIASRLWNAPLVTQVELLKEFYVAETYHQNYFARNPSQGYCQLVIAPKIAKFRKSFPGLLH